LRLGVIKELRPDLIATHASDARAFEGHAFVVEAAVCLGGSNVRPGLNVHRFANRIPLLFEGGSDVVTRTAMKRVNWASYKINVATDKVGVFVSIVSTKIPFKGAGKEYIGAPARAVKRPRRPQPALPHGLHDCSAGHAKQGAN
jgi:DNA topoisomerase VI subunit B